MDINQALDRISTQTKIWIWFGRSGPILFLISVISLYTLDHTVIPSILYIGWTVFILTSIIWWVWIIKTMNDMIRLYETTFNLIDDIKDEIIDVREDLNIIKRSSNN